MSIQKSFFKYKSIICFLESIILPLIKIVVFILIKISTVKLLIMMACKYQTILSLISGNAKHRGINIIEVSITEIV